MTPRLFHVSEQAGIARFEPRTPPGRDDSPAGTAVVWAVEERLLHNYLLPRDCPRVTFYPRPDSDPAEVERFFGSTLARAVVAVEWGWLERIRRTTLVVYELPGATFRVADTGAGYWTSEVTVVPLSARLETDLLPALAERNVELRLVPSLWPLRDAVVGSTLQFSFIRMRNAHPR